MITRRTCLAHFSAAALGLATGCGGPQPTPPAENAAVVDDRPLRVLVVDGPAAAAEIRRRWQAEIDTPLVVSERTTAEMGTRSRLDADVVVYPERWLGIWGARDLLAPLSDKLLASADFARGEWLTHARGAMVQWGAHTLGAALSCPQLLLYYRADLLERAKLAPPDTWRDYERVCMALTTVNGAGHSDGGWTPAVEPLAGDWGALALLARAASYARHASDYDALFDARSMAPLVASPPFERALTELVHCCKLSGGKGITSTPDDARQAIYAGATALAWTWPSAAASQTLGTSAPAASHQMLAQLPGSSEVFNRRTAGANKWERLDPGSDPRVPLIGVGGFVASVTAEARSTERSETLLAWLLAGDASGGISRLLSAAAPVRTSQIKSLGPWCEEALPAAAQHAYGEALARVHAQPRVLAVPAIPGREAYLAELAEHVRSAASDKQSPGEALAAVAAAWEKITDAHDRGKQRAAYRRSLGLDGEA